MSTNNRTNKHTYKQTNIKQNPASNDICGFPDVADLPSTDYLIPVQVRTDTSRDGEEWNRTWDSYAKGFQVNPQKSPFDLVYWVGLRRLHRLTTAEQWDLVLLMEWENTRRTFEEKIYPPEIMG